MIPSNSSTNNLITSTCTQDYTTVYSYTLFIHVYVFIYTLIPYIQTNFHLTKAVNKNESFIPTKHSNSQKGIKRSLDPLDVNQNVIFSTT